MTFQQQPVPCPPPWWQPASQCFDQVKQFEEMLQAMVDKSVTDKLNAVIQQGALPPGVVDGSDAKTGQVGEFIRGEAEVNFAAYPADTVTTTSPLVVPAGDWDLFGIAEITTPVGFLAVSMSPVPAGISDAMRAQEGGFGATAAMSPFNTVRGSFTVPTLLAFSVEVHQSPDPGLAAGTAIVIVCGRRVR